MTDVDCGNFARPCGIAERIAVAIPVKRLDGEQKTRLIPLLNDRARRELVLAMLEDVLAACRALDAFEMFVEVGVISSDPRVASLCREHSLTYLPEPDPPGLNRAVEEAVHWAKQRNAHRLVVILGDLPLLHPVELSRLLRAVPSLPVLFVPDHRGQGTNLLVMRPPGAMAPEFGPDSRVRHRQRAQDQGLRWGEIRLPWAGRDVDFPDDLRWVAAVLWNLHASPDARGAFSHSAVPPTQEALEPKTDRGSTFLPGEKTYQALCAMGFFTAEGRRVAGPLPESDLQIR